MQLSSEVSIVIGFQPLLEVAQRAKAAALEFFDPAHVDFMQGNGVEVVELFPAVPDDRNEVRILEQLQMLGHGLPRHVHVLAECRDRLAVLAMQLVEKAPAGRVGQCLEYLVDVRASRFQ